MTSLFTPFVPYKLRNSTRFIGFAVSNHFPYFHSFHAFTFFHSFSFYFAFFIRSFHIYIYTLPIYVYYKEDISFNQVVPRTKIAPDISCLSLVSCSFPSILYLPSASHLRYSNFQFHSTHSFHSLLYFIHHAHFTAFRSSVRVFHFFFFSPKSSIRLISLFSLISIIPLISLFHLLHFIRAPLVSPAAVHFAGNRFVFSVYLRSINNALRDLFASSRVVFILRVSFIQSLHSQSIRFAPVIHHAAFTSHFVHSLCSTPFAHFTRFLPFCIPHVPSCQSHSVTRFMNNSITFKYYNIAFFTFLVVYFLHFGIFPVGLRPCGAHQHAAVSRKPFQRGWGAC